MNIKVINVGQGDSLILQPEQRCRYMAYEILIDVGNKRDVFEKIKSNKYIILLSHAHKDHIGGLSYLFTNKNYLDKLKEIWIPQYFREISIITDLILKLRGINKIPADNPNLINANNSVTSAKLLNRLKWGLKNDIVIRTLDEKMGRICDHIKILNPPSNLQDLLDLNIAEINAFYTDQRDTDFHEIRKWFDEDIFPRLRASILTEGWYDDLTFNPEDSQENGNLFIYGMLLKLKEKIERFTAFPSNKTFNEIIKAIELTSHEACIVMKYSTPRKSALFTGDANKKVFNRIIGLKHDISSDILKVPHHGSKYNLNKRILKKIDPRWAIVCHNNGRFGRQIDPHPNKAIIDLLDDFNVSVLYTNDIWKENKILKTRPAKYSFSRDIQYLN